MKNKVLVVTGLYFGLLSGTVVADNKKAEIQENNSSIAASDAVKLEANVRFVETFTVMGEGEPGQEYRKEIEAKRDMAAETVQEEAKKFEKSRLEYANKASTMTDVAREKEEKKLMKMERDIKNMATEKEEELKLDMQLATEQLAHNMEAAVVELAIQENVDIVFDKMTGRAIYVSQDFDWTDKVMKRVNENHQIKVAQNKKQQEVTKVVENKKTVEKTVKS